jgi:RNA polymerase sigma-70 factor (ECF subfamily)
VTADQDAQAGQLMREAQAGDHLAYAGLLTLLVPIARRYARGRVGPLPCVEDIVQETLLTIHRARHTYDPRRPFAPWFYAILSSRLIDVMRRERRIGSREQGRDELPDAGGSLPTSDPRQEVDIDRVRAALAALPERQREVVRALKLGDESVREVSARLKMSESAVKVTAHRGYRALRRLLGADKP